MKLVERNILPSRADASVHAASIAFFQNHLVAAWFEGFREGDPSVCIHIHNINNKNEDVFIGNKDAMPRWNPILFTHNKRLFLFEKAGYFCDRWQTFFHDITDLNNTASNKEIYHNAIVVPAGFNGPVKSKPIFIDNVMYCGSSVETAYDWTSYVEAFHLHGSNLEPLWRSNPIRPSKKVSYTLPMSGQTATTMGIIQPTLWHGDDGTLKALFRSSNGLGRIFTSSAERPFSKWSVPSATSLPNPNSGMDVVCHNKRLFVACNPSENERFPLVLLELDKDFDIIDTMLIDEKSDSYRSPEVSYPYIIYHDGRIHCVHTCGRAQIVHTVIEI